MPSVTKRKRNIINRRKTLNFGNIGSSNNNRNNENHNKNPLKKLKHLICPEGSYPINYNTKKCRHEYDTRLAPPNENCCDEGIPFGQKLPKLLRDQTYIPNYFHKKSKQINKKNTIQSRNTRTCKYNIAKSTLPSIIIFIIFIITFNPIDTINTITTITIKKKSINSRSIKRLFRQTENTITITSTTSKSRTFRFTIW